MEKLLAENDLFHQIGAFGRREIEQVVYFPKRHGKEMPGVIGEAIEDQIGKR